MLYSPCPKGWTNGLMASCLTFDTLFASNPGDLSGAHDHDPAQNLCGIPHAHLFPHPVQGSTMAIAG